MPLKNKSNIVTKMMVIQARVAQGPKSSNTGMDNTLSQTTAIELMPPDRVATYVTNTKLTNVVMCTKKENKRLCQTNGTIITIKTDVNKLRFRS